MNSPIAYFSRIFQLFRNNCFMEIDCCFETFYYSAAYKKIKRITWILLAIRPELRGNCAFPQNFDTGN